MTRNERIGQIGEDLVQELLGGTLSEDKYDMDKDLTLEDGTEVEVKTQARWVKENAFTITANSHNLQKCLDVDRLIFVEYGKNDNILIWEDNIRKHKVMRTPTGQRAVFPRSQMRIIATLDKPQEAAELRSLSGTDIKWMRDP